MDHEKKQAAVSIIIEEVPRQDDGQSNLQFAQSSIVWMDPRNAQSCLSYLRPARARPMLRRFAYAFVPQILRTHIYNDTIADSKIGPTSWMDGLRGLAAVSVLNYHFFFAFTGTTNLGWGATEHDYWLHQLPVFRLAYDGATCVNIFFTVAGYVCSMKALQLMSENKYEKVLQSLSASVFRRFFRLYLPVFCITFLWAMMAYLGCFNLLRAMMDDKKTYFPGAFSEVNIQQFPTFAEQIHYWLSDMFRLGNVWWIGPVYATHDNHLWTIAYEYRTSMHLYISLLGLATCKSYVRLAWLCGLASIYFAWDRWEGPLFFLGAAMAQWDIIRNQSQQSLPGTQTNAENSKTSITTRLTRLMGYSLGLYLMSFPIGGYKKLDPLYGWVNLAIPRWIKRKDKFPKSVGTLLLFFMLTTSKNTITAPRPSILHKLFTSRFAQYCGKIMFALYLVHGGILHFIGYGFPHMIWAIVGHDTVPRYIFGLLLGWLASLLLCFWAADVFTREVDAKCAKVIKYFETWCFTKK